jgi:hypothetical protein
MRTAGRRDGAKRSPFGVDGCCSAGGGNSGNNISGEGGSGGSFGTFATHAMMTGTSPPELSTTHMSSAKGNRDHYTHKRNIVENVDGALTFCAQRG